MAVTLFCRIIIVLALLPSILLILPGVEDIYSIRRIIQLFMITVLVVSLVFNRWFFNCYRREFLLLLLLTAMALLSSVLFSTSEFYLVDVFFLPFWLLAVLALASWINQAGLERLLQFTLIVVVMLEFIYACITLFLYQGLIRSGEINLAEYLPWGYHNIRFWGHTATWLLPLMPLALRLQVPMLSTFWRPMVYFSAGVMGWLVMLSMARGSLVALLFATLVVSVLAGRKILGWLIDMVRLAALGVGLWLLFSWLIPEIFIKGELTLRAMHFTSSGRLPLWLESWQMSLQHFPLGMGGQSWLTHEVITQEYSESLKFGSPHNMYLQWAAEYGWLYVLTLAAFWFFVLGVPYLRTRLREVDSTFHQSARIALLISFSAACTHALVSGVFWVPAAMLMGTVICALLIASIQSQNKSEATVKQSIRLNQIITGAMIVCLLFWVFEIEAYYQAMRMDYRDAKDSVEMFAPRFWLHGSFPH